jgi:hypothetical protein
MQQPRIEQALYHQLLLVDNSVVKVGQPFPGTDKEVIGVINLVPELVDEDGMTPAEYECWVLPELLMAVVKARVTFERAKQQQQQVPAEAISQLVRNEAELDAKVPLIPCYTVQASQVRAGVKLVPIELAKQEMFNFYAALHGLDVEDDEDEDEQSGPQPQVPTVAATVSANGG